MNHTEAFSAILISEKRYLAKVRHEVKTCLVRLKKLRTVDNLACTF